MQEEFNLMPDLSSDGFIADIAINTVDEIGEEAQTKRFDCAQAFTELMLLSALRVEKQPIKLPIHHGLYIIVAPDDDWFERLKYAVHDQCLETRPRPNHRGKSQTSSLSQAETFELRTNASAKDIEFLGGSVEHQLIRGATAIIIAGSLRVVPAALQTAAETIITLPAPGRHLLAKLVRKIAPKSKRVILPDIAYDMITPAILRLAYRQHDTAHQFLRRLKALTTKPHTANTHDIITLARMHGINEVKRWAAELKTDLAAYHARNIKWSDLSRGLLVSGPPGSGKTTIAKAVAYDCGMAFIETGYAAWQRSGDGHLGDVLSGMAKSFDLARSQKPSILFMDELDSIGSRRQTDQHQSWYRAIINALLEQMNSGEKNEGVIFIGATNHPQIIDPAILRSGRMEQHLVLDLPNADGLASIYRDQLAEHLEGAVDFQKIGLISAGMCGADVVKTCAMARRSARNANRPVRYEDIIAAISGEADLTDPAQQRCIAIHESGHAIAALTYPQLLLKHISIIARGNSVGGALFFPKDSLKMTPADISAYLTALLAGRAAEEVFLGEASSGSGGGDGCDLAHATKLAVRAELSLGFSNDGLIWHSPVSTTDTSDLLNKRRDIEYAIRQRLDHAYQQALTIIKANAVQTRKLAEHLLLVKVMAGDEIRAVVQKNAATFAAALLAPEEKDLLLNLRKFH